MRYFIELSYKGTFYHGWQAQPKAISIQESLNKALTTIFRKTIDVVGAGRTDAGVHAEQLFAHVDVSEDFDKNDLVYKLNSLLPSDIVIQNIFATSDKAHARFDATSRSYEYRIFLGRNPFLIDTTWQLINKKLNVDKMNEAAQILLTYTDFKSFSKTKTDVKTYNCDVRKAVWVQSGGLLTFYITADRFLRNMVRAIVGTLLDVGLEKITLEKFREIIESRERCNAGTSAPAKGLFLTQVTYPKTIFIHE
ncbi:MAG: tRNA pseudouridine(38-40) synthase TruA [Lutibacter sp.]|uniref:tRNA pseudouridine(38-40) synthase TruA n=1 Tax=Lutibacter sp. TaxID=1925666 RepID=UPI0017F038DA|nr:tRNA pseudouridine(38-40) synthase TruA [Lutibacter sp.]MBT8316535.1 tRNA pseudouridine(38-40) synthase TruA [Lutibacter sp.]NNJ57395.1 tRNA pseudouridine(38-40) synthase TruA [Lutibacter sp.]